MRSWKLRDMVVLVILAVVCGGLYFLLDEIYQLISALWIPIQGLENGLWWVSAILIPYIIRRPGAALLAELVSASIELALGSNWGITNLWSGIYQGVGAELGFLLFAYRRFNGWSVTVAGLLAGIGNLIQWFVTGNAGKLSMTVIVFYCAFTLVSGIVLGGWLPKWVADALNRAGILRNFAIGRETRALKS